MVSSELGAGDQQVTIFYSGKVTVFANVPAEKVHAIMLLLSGCSMQNRGSASKTTASDHAVLDAEHDDPSKTRWTGNTAPAFSFHAAAGNASVITIALKQLHRKQYIRAQTKRSQASELPFARKASLVRFLETRKDRVEAMQKKKDGTVP